MTQKKELLNTLDLKKGDLIFNKIVKYCVIILDNRTDITTGRHIYGRSIHIKHPALRRLDTTTLDHFKKLC